MGGCGHIGAARWALLGAGLISGAACTHPAEPEPLQIALVMPTPPDQPGRLPNVDWAVEQINAAGGVAGRPLAVTWSPPRPDAFAEQGAELAADEAILAVIGPPGSRGLLEMADAFADARKPVVSTTSTSDDVLRAWGGKDVVWRTRESDVAQTELILRQLVDTGARRITVLASLGSGGYTFFSWAGFFAAELGLTTDEVHVVALPEETPCEAAVAEVLATRPEAVVVAPETPEDQLCVLSRLPRAGPMRVVLADTGLDPYALLESGQDFSGVEGYLGGGDEAYPAAFQRRFGDQRPAPHGRSEYDAVLLLAYALEVSGGRGGDALLSALREVVDGAAPGVGGWEQEGVAATLRALRLGVRPALRGATGPLRFEPELYTDLRASTLSRYRIRGASLEIEGSVSTDDPSFLSNDGVLVRPTAAGGPQSSSWAPAREHVDTWALIAALSSGWSNYRHEADALQQYQRLRSAGVPDDHIVLVLADEIADHERNLLPGVVRNAPGGVDVRAEGVVDGDLTLTREDLSNILLGRATEATPEVLRLSSGSNLLVYLVGHGGTGGLPIGASTTAEGLSAEGTTLTPADLRGALCALRAEQRLRRGLVIIESCFSGAFGDAAYGGLEAGCEDGPLEGVTLLTAATSREVSFAGAYDAQVRSWVNDSFSRNLFEAGERYPEASLADLYLEAYRATAGSHPTAYNTAHAGLLSAISWSEFGAP
jgi:ABC-type branched-subunit amino acid transport system substrate-binding protein